MEELPKPKIFQGLGFRNLVGSRRRAEKAQVLQLLQPCAVAEEVNTSGCHPGQVALSMGVLSLCSRPN